MSDAKVLLRKLPFPYNQMALINMEKQKIISSKTYAPYSALLFFSWNKSNEGAEFWDGIYNNCIHHKWHK